MPPTPQNRIARVLRWLAAPAALLVATAALAEDTGERRRVPPEMVGAYCPPTGCPPAAGNGWHTAGFATALGLIAALSRRRPG